MGLKEKQHPRSLCSKFHLLQSHPEGPLEQVLKYDQVWVNSSWKGGTWIIDAGTSHGLRVFPSIFLLPSRTFQPPSFIFDSVKVKQSLHQLLTRRHPKVKDLFEVNWKLVPIMIVITFHLEIGFCWSTRCSGNIPVLQVNHSSLCVLCAPRPHPCVPKCSP